jgi:hypothetical protein
MSKQERCAPVSHEQAKLKKMMWSSIVETSFQNDTLKNNRKKAQQSRQKVKISSPTGSLGGATKSVFCSFSSPGDPWNQNGPKTSPKSLRHPPGRHFVMIFDQFWTPFLVVVVALWVFFEPCGTKNKEQRTKNKERRTKNEVGTVAEMARRATGYIYIYIYYMYIST